MTTDERIDALVERHEALTQTVELMSQMQQSAQRENERLLREMLLAMARLANTGQAHNEQLADHEERIGKLEGRAK